jgi:hypothetical protein
MIVGCVLLTLLAFTQPSEIVSESSSSPCVVINATYPNAPADYNTTLNRTAISLQALKGLRRPPGTIHHATPMELGFRSSPPARWRARRRFLYTIRPGSTPQTTNLADSSTLLRGRSQSTPKR